MALIGLVLLFSSIFVAVGAPVLTPYDPSQPLLAAPYSPPAWLSAFPDVYRLSQNLVPVADPGFSSTAAVQAWSLSASPAPSSNLELSYAPGVATSSSRGSLQLVYTGSGTGTAAISKTFHYLYHGPPQSFFATVSFMVQGVSTSQPVGLAAFINRVGDQNFNLWTGNVTENGKWLQPPNSLDSHSQGVQTAVGTAGTILNPAEVIFSTIQDYSFGIQVTFFGPARVNLTDLQIRLFGTSWGLLGTDFVGADVASQLFYGARISLIVGLLSAAIGIGLGLIVGLIAGFLGPLVDEVLMRFTDMMLVIPGLPLLIVLVAVLGANILNIIIIIGFFGWMGFARIIRSQVLTLKERPFVEAAKAAGAGNGRIMFSHIFPNIVGLTDVNWAFSVLSAIPQRQRWSF